MITVDELFHRSNPRDRCWRLWNHKNELFPGDYWEAVRWAWSDSDRQNMPPSYWRSLWEMKKPGREAAMTDTERELLTTLPERVTVYRGLNGRNRVAGLSWTFDEATAHWFALRYKADDEATARWLALRVKAADEVTARWLALRHEAYCQKVNYVIKGTVLRSRILNLIEGENELIIPSRFVYDRWRVKADLELRDQEVRKRQENNEQFGAVAALDV